MRSIQLKTVSVESFCFVLFDMNFEFRLFTNEDKIVFEKKLEIYRGNCSIVYHFFEAKSRNIWTSNWENVHKKITLRINEIIEVKTELTKMITPACIFDHQICDLPCVDATDVLLRHVCFVPRACIESETIKKTKTNCPKRA